MATASDAPADTTMMRIVHDALRRDLARATTALTTTDPEQRRAIGAHLGWMMRFLGAHHASEDEGLYPLVRQRAGGAVDILDVLDRMTREHEDLTAAISTVDAAASALADDASDEAARMAVAALDALGVLLRPHLREEEDEAMPITSRLITAAEWQAIEKKHNLDPKSMSELGFEGHWLIDSASDADRAIVIGLVPPIARFVLLHAFGRRYRRHLKACWADARKARRRVQTENSVTVTVAADIDDVWDVVRDVTRVGEWSHECVGAAWLGTSTSARPGARFRGRNRAGVFRWGRVCEIVTAEPYRLVWVTVPTALYPDSSEWQITLDEVDGGTRISQRFHVLRAPKVLSVLYAAVIPAHRDRTAALVEDLKRLGTVATRSRARHDPRLARQLTDHADSRHET
jgi:hemerythrin-like domain-containing protein